MVIIPAPVPATITPQPLIILGKRDPKRTDGLWEAFFPDGTPYRHDLNLKTFRLEAQRQAISNDLPETHPVPAASFFTATFPRLRWYVMPPRYPSPTADAWRQQGASGGAILAHYDKPYHFAFAVNDQQRQQFHEAMTQATVLGQVQVLCEAFANMSAAATCPPLLQGIAHRGDIEFLLRNPVRPDTSTYAIWAMLHRLNLIDPIRYYEAQDLLTDILAAAHHPRTPLSPRAESRLHALDLIQASAKHWIPDATTVHDWLQWACPPVPVTRALVQLPGGGDGSGAVGAFMPQTPLYHLEQDATFARCLGAQGYWVVGEKTPAVYGDIPLDYPLILFCAAPDRAYFPMKKLYTDHLTPGGLLLALIPATAMTKPLQRWVTGARYAIRTVHALYKSRYQAVKVYYVAIDKPR